MRPRKADKLRVEGLIRKWQPRLLLQGWTITPQFEAVAPKEHNDTSGQPLQTLAEVKVVPRYKDARITLYPPFWDGPTHYQELTLIHEMTHPITDPVKRVVERAANAGLISDDEAIDLIETLTEDISKIAQAAYDRRKKPPLV